MTGKQVISLLTGEKQFTVVGGKRLKLRALPNGVLVVFKDEEIEIHQDMTQPGVFDKIANLINEMYGY